MSRPRKGSITPCSTSSAGTPEHAAQSGSGKSSLVSDTLVPLARAALHGANVDPVDATLEGLDRITWM